jgi:hypothetical protein
MRLKKIYYLPGLISLLGLPVLLLFLGPEDYVRPNCIHIGLPSDQKPSQGNSHFTKYDVYAAIKKKKIIRVTLWDTEYGGIFYNTTDAKLDFIHREMERLQFTHDTFSVLKVELGDQNSYGDFVWLINEAIKYDINRWAFTDDAFYFLPTAPRERLEKLELTVDPIDMSNYHPSSQWDRFKWRMSYWWEETWYMIKKNYLIETGFVLLIFIPAVIRIKKRKKYLTTPLPSP